MARMVDVGDKAVVRREATAEGFLVLKPSTVEAVSKGTVKKGDVMTASKLAGIQAAKSTSSILPLCHQIPLSSVEVEVVPEGDRLRSRCTVRADYRTGVEMEALVGVTVALLNAWDMVKYLEKDEAGQYRDAKITDVRVIEKRKGG
ncbi:MAG: cyclic pyranopterin monophosphate synthase MoaC [Thermoplasmata archaeon]|jgi:cyclic pyranopterin phosphate synthase|nr:cyclic pyranopterin monophosphate synthase MoaC [Thermoplasmata archaeon]